MISCPQVFLVCGHIYFGRGWCVFIFASKLSPPNKFEVRKQHPQKDEKTNNIVVWNTFLSLEIPMCWCDRVALKLSCCGTICIKHPANTHRSIKYCHTHTLPLPLYLGQFIFSLLGKWNCSQCCVLDHLDIWGWSGSLHHHQQQQQTTTSLLSR